MAEVDYIGHALPARGVVLLVNFPVPTKTYFYWINKITRLSSANEYFYLILLKAILCRITKPYPCYFLLLTVENRLER